MNSPALIDMPRFAAELAGRRNRAALLLSPQLGNQRAYAAQLAGLINAPHLDVLECFPQDESLMKRLVTFSVDDLFALIAGQKDQSILVVSGIEFLLGTWLCQHEPKAFKTELCQKIEYWERSPAFILVTHEDPIFASYQPERHRGSRVVLHTSQTLALE